MLTSLETLLTLLTNSSRTLSVWIISLIVGLFFGLFIGLLTGISEKYSSYLYPILGYLRAVPPIALFPVALIAVGPGQVSIGTVATLGAVLYVFPGVSVAARQARDKYSDLSHVLNCSKSQFIVMFIIPGAFQHLISSSRVAATYSFAVCVAGEMIIGGRYGMGAAILDYSERFALEEAYLYVMVTGAVGLVIDVIFQRISRFFVKT